MYPSLSHDCEARNRRDGYLFRANPIVIGVIVIGVIVGASLLCIHVNLVFMVSSSWGMVAEAWFVVIFRIALLLACVAVWRGTGACVCRAQAGDGEGVPSVLGSENFFSGERKNFPWAGSKFSRSKGGKFPIRAGGASSLKTGGPLGATAVAETGAEGVVCSYL